MSGNPSLPGASLDHNAVGPDYYGFYTKKLIELLSEDDDSLQFLPQRPPPSSGDRVVLGDDINQSVTENDYLVRDLSLIRRPEDLFSGPIGANLHDFKKEKLRSLLRESLFTYSKEVNDMQHSVLSVSRMRSQLEEKKKTLSLQSAENISGHDNHPQKKQKVSSTTSDLEEKPIDVVFSGEEMMGISGKCEQHIKSSSTLSEAPEDKDKDLESLINEDCTVVEKYVKICSDELLDTIAAMEQKLEDYIDIVISTFRPLTHLEKHKLRKLIMDLPARNMERVAEIISRNKPVDVDSCDEIHVDLENENKVTLWRLYYYVEAVENARKLGEA